MDEIKEYKMQVCASCKARSEAGARFCGACGKPFVKAPSTGLNKMPVPLLILYVLITFGIYTPVWFLKRIEAFNKLDSIVKMGSGVFGFILAGFIVNLGIMFYMVFTGLAEGVVADSLSPLARNLMTSSDYLTFAVQVAVVLQAFKVRRILHDHFNVGVNEKPLKEQTDDELFSGSEEVKPPAAPVLKISWVWTLLFGLFYLQYKINRLPGH